MQRLTREEFIAECTRRRRLGFTVADPRTCDLAWRKPMQELGGLWDKRLRVWLMPDREAIDRAAALLATPAPPPRPRVFEIRTRREVAPGGPYRSPAERIADGYPPAFVVEHVRRVNMPGGYPLFVLTCRAT